MNNKPKNYVPTLNSFGIYKNVYFPHLDFCKNFASLSLWRKRYVSYDSYNNFCTDYLFSKGNLVICSKRKHIKIITWDLRYYGIVPFLSLSLLFLSSFLFPRPPCRNRFLPLFSFRVLFSFEYLFLHFGNTSRLLESHEVWPFQAPRAFLDPGLVLE